MLDRLAAWKSRYGERNTGELEHLLDAIAKQRFTEPSDLIRLHETLLFLCAYPHGPGVDEEGLPDDPVATAEDKIGANEDETEG